MTEILIFVHQNGKMRAVSVDEFIELILPALRLKLEPVDDETPDMKMWAAGFDEYGKGD